ncbi:hypothetical protein [Glutamicibacter endophyticus]|uniref:hypothetical protein n=1 Tax=Glutamicibacter endophyticus TaxID=1522174 RepID=UPI003AF01530
MIRSPRIARRAWLSLGALLGTLSLTTSAVLVDRVDFLATGTATKKFNLQVAASTQANFTPRQADWTEANPTAAVVGLAPTDGRFLPGEERRYVIAVRCTEDGLPAVVRLSLTGTSLPSVSKDLLPALQLSLEHDGKLLARGQGSLSARLPGLVRPGAVEIFSVRVLLPTSAGNELQGAGTKLRLRVDGISV